MERVLVALETVRYDKASGLVPVVVQDVTTGLVLMVAYANREALKRTYGTGDAWFWSRSRQAFWHKGETSGNVLRVQEVRVDCDGDSVLYLVEPTGPACHTGETTCFHRVMVRHVEGGAVADGATVYGDATCREIGAEEKVGDGGDALTLDEGVLSQLWTVISSRWRERPQGSYTTYLFEHGIDKVAKKVGEEATEVVIAAKNATQSHEGTAELAAESADLVFHLLALWKVAGLTPNEVFRILQERAK